ncbi:L-aspartate oxidase [Gloeobacter kilaueensis]|uniref:L-aspartate oxidase n=1 Tax=Gloeobacter kilaueensis (strain ATCC BAA-2537 / CCAP 1431/1 / ULC 316 / JS1) TaxID=1183438 RepID=U5QMY7_GLOK1|nr:L-aspartate oxidase [Gloeobacter kilaueensis]AGY60268.1 L-aspartate oxidase [Gloeobacter kilaueensis JS1]
MKAYDAIIVGSGAAGLYTALKLPRDWRVALLTKENLTLSASQWAQGGIAAVVESDDSFGLHYEDTLKAGAGLCEPEAVRVLVEEAPARIGELIGLGVEFDRYQGRLAVTLEAAHSRRRILHAADATGRELVRALVEEVRALGNIRVIEEALAIDLAIDGGRCRGVLVDAAGTREWYMAPVTVLATGGAGQVFATTTNPAVATGDGLAMAARAGVCLRDLEFVQFHPTVLSLEGAPRFLITEAVRGEGAHLINLAGERFMGAYDPRLELAPRDVVARAIFDQLQRTGAGHVLIDFRPIGEATIAQRFPTIAQVCRKFGIDVFDEPVPVAPAAHYWMGGIVTDLDGRTSLPGLYAVGEVASTGVQGANRLASNSLLECLVFAHRIALAVRHSRESKPEVIRFPPAAAQQPSNLELVQRIRNELPWLVWRTCGIIREQAGLQKGLEQLQFWKQQILDDDSTSERSALEVRNLVIVAELLLRSALFRTESRGAHYRRDYPASDSAWQVHTEITANRLAQTPLSVATIRPFSG